MTEQPPELPQRSVRLDESICISGEENENIIAAPTDLANPVQVTGPHNRTKLAISELKDEPERNRYVEKEEARETCKIIRNAEKIGRIIQEMANVPTQATLCDLEIPKRNVLRGSRPIPEQLPLGNRRSPPRSMPNYGK